MENEFSPKDNLDRIWIDQRYLENVRKYGKQNQTLDEFRDMMFCVKSLCDSKLGKIPNWKRFRSPGEVLGFKGFSYFWDPKFILVNKKIGNFTPDLSLTDINGNIIIPADVQGSHHDDDEQKEKDFQKKEYYHNEMQLELLQVKGTFIKNDFYKFVILAKATVNKLYKQHNISFLPVLRSRKRGKTKKA